MQFGSICRSHTSQEMGDKLNAFAHKILSTISKIGQCSEDFIKELLEWSSCCWTVFRTRKSCCFWFFFYYYYSTLFLFLSANKRKIKIIISSLQSGYTWLLKLFQRMIFPRSQFKKLNSATCYCRMHWNKTGRNWSVKREADEGDLRKSWHGLSRYTRNLLIIAFIYSLSGTFSTH